MKTGRNDAQLRIRVPPKIHDWIEREAAANFRSKSLQVSLILAGVMDKQERAAERRTKRSA
jgi:hypothetical protein